MQAARVGGECAVGVCLRSARLLQQWPRGVWGQRRGGGALARGGLLLQLQGLRRGAGCVRGRRGQVLLLLGCGGHGCAQGWHAGHGAGGCGSCEVLSHGARLQGQVGRIGRIPAQAHVYVCACVCVRVCVCACAHVRVFARVYVCILGK